ncbi:hypothetical protein ACJMK2_022436 [Sinanodonta woodiana]|uniref:Endonuclease/exonuclease/phosphatase domain-containing protein n=1 Tax=Sinanodonta woodiana TaxID=1069815 RepID=A0ABD3TJ23_SINWO
MILTRYDVVLVQEIRDLTDGAFETLRHLMNEELKAKHVTDVYEKVVSARLGRTNSKEQYGFLFRKSKVHLSDSYQYPDPGDIFEREPFVVHFSSSQTVVADFAIAGIHTSPTHAKDEIGNLTKVYDAIKQHWHLDNVIIMGDFNMDCNYVSHTASRLNPLRQDSRFVWLIGDGLDTTIGDETHCTYDRIVLGGTQLQHSVTPSSVHVFRFDEEWHIPKDQGSYTGTLSYYSFHGLSRPWTSTRSIPRGGEKEPNVKCWPNTMRLIDVNEMRLIDVNEMRLIGVNEMRLTDVNEMRLIDVNEILVIHPIDNIIVFIYYSC